MKKDENATPPNNRMLLYKDENGSTQVSVLFSDEDVWLTQQQLAEIYDTTQQNISQHIDGIFRDRELDEAATHKKFLLVRKEGTRQVERNIEHYNLDMVIAVGYRVQSPIATRFRRWATARLHEYIQKGFALDDERLKQGGNRYFRELLQRIRDIRSSERNFYQQVTDIYATSIDYDPRAEITKKFFATVQNKLHFAVHEHTDGCDKTRRDDPVMDSESVSVGSVEAATLCGNHRNRSDGHDFRDAPGDRRVLSLPSIRRRKSFMTASIMKSRLSA